MSEELKRNVPSEEEVEKYIKSWEGYLKETMITMSRSAAEVGDSMEPPEDYEWKPEEFEILAQIVGTTLEDLDQHWNFGEWRAVCPSQEPGEPTWEASMYGDGWCLKFILGPLEFYAWEQELQDLPKAAEALKVAAKSFTDRMKTQSDKEGEQ